MRGLSAGSGQRAGTIPPRFWRGVQDDAGGARKTGEVAPDALELVQHRDAMRLQMLARPDPRELEELGRVDRAGGEHDLAPRLRGELGAVVAVAAPRRPPGPGGES